MCVLCGDMPYNPSTCDREGRRSEVQGQPETHVTLANEYSWGYSRWPCSPNVGPQTLLERGNIDYIYLK